MTPFGSPLHADLLFAAEEFEKWTNWFSNHLLCIDIVTSCNGLKRDWPILKDISGFVDQEGFNFFIRDWLDQVFHWFRVIDVIKIA